MWYTRLVSILQCSVLAISYVASLYLRTTNHNRDDPATVKNRVVAVTFMAIVTPLSTYYFVSSSELFAQYTLWEILGIRLPGFFMAATVPLILTMILFAGPIAIQNQNGHSDLYKEPSYWFDNLTDLLWLRDYIIAPFSEELTFRACMLPILIQCFRPQTAVFVSPIFFGLAHLHHMVGRIRSGVNLHTALLISIFQLSYTTLFGAYSAYLFLRTGHFISAFLTHAFCNLMGFPDFSEVLALREPRRSIIIATCVVGLLAWSSMLGPLTNPSWYHNSLYWKSYV
ncbi:CAAX prenyl protease 2 [Cimex lectularius]|uniref:CAAX prenyl protease 2 n=1 Tax=Cimex lectularius TaxID=79782 RepID=A0A8I6RPR4_CIMLE|nr:CAAX prenyl protease 2 [Cimex lectularius]